MKMRFCKLNLGILCTLFGFCISEEWTNRSVTSKIVLSYVTGIGHMDTVVVMPKGKSVLTCMFHCTEEKYYSFYFFETNETCLCNSGYTDSGNIVTGYTGVLYGAKKTYAAASYSKTSNKQFKRIDRQPAVFDCLSLYELGYRENGVYVIKPEEDFTVDVWCDMSNGGWTVIQRRQDGSEDFYRGWDEYKDGFGNKTGEYWLGLKYIHLLVTIDSSLFIEMESFGEDSTIADSAFAEYSTFKVNDENDKYRLSVGGFSGNCSDSLAYQNGRRFSTFDDDNDGNSKNNCAEGSTGAWWYNACHRSNLNGMYLGGAGSEYPKGITWFTCWGHRYSLKRTVMKIRRNT